MDLDILTPKEYRIFNLLACTDLDRVQIANVVNISTRTIDVHCASIYRKLKVFNRVQLIFLALDNGNMLDLEIPRNYGKRKQ